MALVKYNNNSISAITTAGTLATGAMVLIKEQTASSSSTISFVDGTSDVVLDSTYPIYLFHYTNIHPSADAGDFKFNGSTDSGSNYNVTKTNTTFEAGHDESDSWTSLGYNTATDLAQSTSFSELATDIGYDNDQHASGLLYLFSPSNTTFVKHFISTGIQTHSSNAAYNEFTGGYFNTTSAIDAIQFKMSTGNIDAGTIKLYGLKDS